MSQPKAAQLQGGSNEWDGAATLAVRLAVPQRRWWWGILSREPHPCAWCYLCDTRIATWSGRWPMTEGAKLAIAEHRNQHIQGRLHTPATETQT